MLAACVTLPAITNRQSFDTVSLPDGIDLNSVKDLAKTWFGRRCAPSQGLSEMLKESARSLAKAAHGQGPACPAVSVVTLDTMGVS